MSRSWLGWVVCQFYDIFVLNGCAKLDGNLDFPELLDKQGLCFEHSFRTRFFTRNGTQGIRNLRKVGKLVHLVVGIAGKRSTVAVANLHPVPVVEICRYAFVYQEFRIRDLVSMNNGRRRRRCRSRRRAKKKRENPHRCQQRLVFVKNYNTRI